MYLWFLGRWLCWNMRRLLLWRRRLCEKPLCFPFNRFEGFDNWNCSAATFLSHPTFQVIDKRTINSCCILILTSNVFTHHHARLSKGWPGSSVHVDVTETANPMPTHQQTYDFRSLFSFLSVIEWENKLEIFPFDCGKMNN